MSGTPATSAASATLIVSRPGDGAPFLACIELLQPMSASANTPTAGAMAMALRADV
jgi:hypothetical protein